MKYRNSILNIKFDYFTGSMSIHNIYFNSILQNLKLLAYY